MLARAPRGLQRRRESRAPSARHVARCCQLKHATKRAAMRDCGRRCVYCATPLELQTATLDHVHPLSKGGVHLPGNLVAACAPCNRLKGDLLPYDFFLRFPWAGANFMRYARSVHRALKRGARRAVSLAYAEAA